jgi:hypothetical protein
MAGVGASARLAKSIPYTQRDSDVHSRRVAVPCQDYLFTQVSAPLAGGFWREREG